MNLMIQRILRTNDKEALTYVPESDNKQAQGSRTNTTVRIKMKNEKSDTLKARAVGVDTRSGGKNEITTERDKNGALLCVSSEERLRRRLSDSLEFARPYLHVRRRSVSFDPITVFKTAILENDVESACGVLASGKVMANTSLDGVLPVILASKEGCGECLELLIENGASIDVCDKRGFTPLELAVQGGHFDCAQILIAYGANDNSIRNGYFDESIEHGRKTTGRSRSRTV